MKHLKVILTICVLAFASHDACAQIPFKQGETFKYAIKKFGMKIGDASLVFNGQDIYKGKDVLLITFTATALNFFDEEKIYVDPISFLPVAVIRDVDFLGTKANIVEEYSPIKGFVEVIKEAGGKTTTQTVDKEGGALDNIYCFIYRYRQNGQLGKDETMKMNLPTKEVTLRIVGRTQIKTAGEVFESEVIESVPRQYKVWFGPGPAKIPLRIDGAVGMVSTSLILSEYE